MFLEFLKAFLSGFFGTILSLIWAIFTYNWIAITIGIVIIIFAISFVAFLIAVSRARRRAFFTSNNPQ